MKRLRKPIAWILSVMMILTTLPITALADEVTLSDSSSSTLTVTSTPELEVTPTPEPEVTPTPEPEVLPVFPFLIEIKLKSYYNILYEE